MSLDGVEFYNNYPYDDIDGTESSENLFLVWVLSLDMFKLTSQLG